MRLMFCVSKENGLSFNHRRQSRDSVLLHRIVDNAKLNNATLWVSDYSFEMFQGVSNGAKLSLLNPSHNVFEFNDVVFLEDCEPVSYLNMAHIVYVYNWNRSYPFSKIFVESIMVNDFYCTSRFDFSGTSHEKITENIWVRKNEK